MSSTPISDDEQSEVDGETLSEVVRRPTRTAGDLSQVADASPGITTEGLARDLEAVASKPEAPTERELLEELLRRVKRIEERLEFIVFGLRLKQFGEDRCGHARIISARTVACDQAGARRAVGTASTWRRSIWRAWTGRWS
jgi:hypothetical protein